MKRFLQLLVAGILMIGFTGIVSAETPSADAPSIYSFRVQDIDGKEVSLEQYKGKALLIVNTASKCGYTPQYKSLEALYEQYKDDGLVVLGFPANNFRSQEPGSNEEIKNFCYLNYKVTFPMFSKISVAGEDTQPLYKFLTNDPGVSGPISWNFNKFLIDPKGNIVARFNSPVDPLAPEVTDKIESVLPKSQLETRVPN